MDDDSPVVLEPPLTVAAVKGLAARVVDAHERHDPQGDELGRALFRAEMALLVGGYAEADRAR